MSSCVLLLSIMHRHPEAARALRRSVVRPLMQDGILMYTRAVRWVDAQRSAGAAVAQCVPHKVQLGGDFVTDRRLHKCDTCTVTWSAPVLVYLCFGDSALSSAACLKFTGL